MSFFSYLKISGRLPSFYASIKSQIFTQFFIQLWFDKAIQALPLKPLNTIYAYFYTWFNTHSVELLVALCLFCVLGPSKKKSTITSKKHECKNECQRIQFALVYSSSMEPLSGRHTLF